MLTTAPRARSTASTTEDRRDSPAWASPHPNNQIPRTKIQVPKTKFQANRLSGSLDLVLGFWFLVLDAWFSFRGCRLMASPVSKWAYGIYRANCRATSSTFGRGINGAKGAFASFT